MDLNYLLALLAAVIAVFLLNYNDLYLFTIIL